MKPNLDINQQAAFTKMDLWTVIILVGSIFVFLGLWLPSLSGSKKSPRIACVFNLKQVGLALRMWSSDHGEKFPMAVSTNEGGSLEFIGSGNVFQRTAANK